MPISKRQFVADTLRQEIAAGTFQPSMALPGENALCQRFGITRATLRLALADLERRGLIFRRHGKGTFVNPTRSVMAKPLALLLREPQKASTVGNVPIIAGATYALESVGSYLALVSAPPAKWPAPLIDSVAGVIVVPAKMQQADLTRLDEFMLPHIVVGDSFLDAPHIRFGYAEAASNLVDALLERRHKRFAFISGHDSHGDAVRKAAIGGQLSKAGINPSSVPDYRTNYDPAEALAAANRLLDEHPECTAILCFDDTLALQTIRACQARGIDVPGQKSVAGFGNAPHSALVSPSITTVKIPFEAAGRLAAEMLCRAVLHVGTLVATNLGHELLLRESVGENEGQ